MTSSNEKGNFNFGVKCADSDCHFMQENTNKGSRSQVDSGGSEGAGSEEDPADSAAGA